MELRDCLNLIQFILEVIQPFQGCRFICLIFRGLTPFDWAHAEAHGYSD